MKWENVPGLDSAISCTLSLYQRVSSKSFSRNIDAVVEAVIDVTGKGLEVVVEVEADPIEKGAGHRDAEIGMTDVRVQKRRIILMSKTFKCDICNKFLINLLRA